MGVALANPNFKAEEPSSAGVLEKYKLPIYDVRYLSSALLNNMMRKLTVKMSNVESIAGTRQLIAVNTFFVPKAPF